MKDIIYDAFTEGRDLNKWFPNYFNRLNEIQIGLIVNSEKLRFVLDAFELIRIECSK